MKEKLILIGNGMAGMRTLEELFKHNTSQEAGSDLYDITVIGSEPHPNYNRIMLSPVLAGEQTINDIILNAGTEHELEPCLRHEPPDPAGVNPQVSIAGHAVARGARSSPVSERASRHGLTTRGFLA